MTDRMAVSDPNTPGSPEALHPFDDRSRTYRAFRGKRTGGGRVSSLLFVPQKGSTHMRRLPLVPLPPTDIAFDGTEIIMEFLHLTAVIAGRNLVPVEAGIADGWIAALEAFNPDRRDMPTDDAAPFIERIRFYAKDAQTPEAKPKIAKKLPRHEPETERA